MISHLFSVSARSGKVVFVGVTMIISAVSSSRWSTVRLCLFKCGRSNLTHSLRSKIITKVLATAKDICSTIETVESVINPGQVVEYPLKPTSMLSLSSIKDIASAVVSNKEDVKSMYGPMSLQSLVQLEPYAALDMEVVQFLYHTQNPTLNEKVSIAFLSRFADYLYIVHLWCCLM